MDQGIQIEKNRNIVVGAFLFTRERNPPGFNSVSIQVSYIQKEGKYEP